MQSLIGILVGFAWLGLYNPDQWRMAAGVYIFGLIAFQTSMTYFFAAFPALARNILTLRKKAEELNDGIIEREEYNQADGAERNHVANVSLWTAGAGGIVIIAMMMGIPQSVDANASTENNSWGMSLIIGFGSAVWLAFAMPWFVLEKRRPEQPMPPGMNIFTAVLWQVYRAGPEIWKLRQSLPYLIGMKPSRRASCALSDSLFRLLYSGRALVHFCYYHRYSSEFGCRVRYHDPRQVQYGPIRVINHRLGALHQGPENVWLDDQDDTLRRSHLRRRHDCLGNDRYLD